jgi:hypothetical protein
MPCGQFWYGTNGFLYKKSGGGGARKNPSYGLICNRPTNLYNKYTPGSGVGSSNTSVRRAKLRLATKCGVNQKCGRFYTYLGLFDNYTGNPNGYFPYP